MTSEEAISRLKSDIPKYMDFLDNPNEDEFWEAFDMAIKGHGNVRNDMSKVGVEIIKTEETKESGIKYLNINVSNSEVERNPDIVRLCADAGILEYVKPKTGRWIMHKQYGIEHIECSECSSWFLRENLVRNSYCPNCGCRMV